LKKILKYVGYVFFCSSAIIVGGIILADSENLQPKSKISDTPIKLAERPLENEKTKTIDEALNSFFS
jgi:hypothetical protein